MIFAVCRFDRVFLVTASVAPLSSAVGEQTCAAHQNTFVSFRVLRSNAVVYEGPPP